MKQRVVAILQILALPSIGSQRAFDFIHFLQGQGKDFTKLTMDEMFDNALVFWPKRFSQEDAVLWRSEVAMMTQQLMRSCEAGVKQVSYFDEAYPQNLKALVNPPILLHYLGDLTALNTRPTLAMIGTRTPTAYAIKSATKIAMHLIKQNIHLVSGLAEGCDTIAHQAAVNAQVPTTAILGHGLQTIYPSSNAGLAQQILATGGALVSEYLWGTPVHKGLFVRRDRLQAGIADATFVVETSKEGGSIHAMEETLKCTRPLWALDFPTPLREGKEAVKIAGNIDYIDTERAIRIQSKQDVLYWGSALLTHFQQRQTAENSPMNKGPLVQEGFSW